MTLIDDDRVTAHNVDGVKGLQPADVLLPHEERHDHRSCWGPPLAAVDEHTACGRTAAGLTSAGVAACRQTVVRLGELLDSRNFVCKPVCGHMMLHLQQLIIRTSLYCNSTKMLTCFAASVDEAEHFGRHRLRQQVISQTVLHRDALVDHALRVLSLPCANLQGDSRSREFRGGVPTQHSLLLHYVIGQCYVCLEPSAAHGRQ